MHARELIDLAAVVVAHAPSLLRAGWEIPERGVEGYWVASKSRLDRWGRSLKRFSALLGEGTSPCRAADRARFRGMLEEILAGEMLTRVWSAALSAYDHARRTDRMEPIARSVLIGHMEARHRVLVLVAGTIGLDAEEAEQLNRLRHRVERWTDLLVGYLARHFDVSRFAVDPDRARDFAAELSERQQQDRGQFAWSVMAASLRAAFTDCLRADSPNADLNAQIAASILACFPAHIFGGPSPIPSAWMLRVSYIADEAEQLLQTLLAETMPQEAPPPRRLTEGFPCDPWFDSRGV